MLQYDFSLRCFTAACLFVFTLWAGTPSPALAADPPAIAVTSFDTFDTGRPLASGTPAWHSFSLQAGQGVTVALTPHNNSSTTTWLYLYRPENTTSAFASTSVADGSTKTLSFTAETSGTYYLQVSGPTGSYDLAVFQAYFNNGASDSSRSFYSTPNTSRYASSGLKQVNGYGLADWHRFQVRQGTSVTVSITPHNTGSSSTWFYLYRPDNTGAPFASSSASDGSQRTLTFTAETTGTYYLQVSGPAGSYDLAISGALPEDPSLDQNLARLPQTFSRADLASAVSPATAKPIPFFDRQFKTDYEGGVSRYFSFSLKAGEGVSVALTSHSNSGNTSWFYLYRPENTTSSFASSSASDDMTRTISFTAETTGTYVVEINGPAGSYDLGVYRAYFNSGVSDASRAFYSTPNTARYAAPGLKQVNSYGLSDWHRFQLRQGTTVTVSLTPHNNGGTTTWFYLYRPGSTSSFASNSASSGTTRTLTFTAETTGTYYLETAAPAGSYDLAFNAPLPEAPLLDQNLARLPQTFGRADLATAVSKTTARPIPFFDRQFKTDYEGGVSRYFSFRLQAGEGVSVALTSHTNSGNTTWFYLHRPGSTSSFASGSASDGTTRTISFTADTTGTYVVEINGPAGSYDLGVFRAHFNDGVSDGSRTFYSTPNTARYATTGVKLVNGYGLSDWYRLSVRQGSTVTVTLTPHNNSSSTTWFYLYRSTNTSSSLTSSSASSGSPRTISFTADTTGTYYLEVAAPPGWYDLTVNGQVSAGDGDPKLVAAVPVSDNSQTLGSVTDSGGYLMAENYYVFTATTDGTYRIFTTGSTDTQGMLLDSDGSPLAFAEEGGVYPNFLMTSSLTKDRTYYVMVTGYHPGDYTLNIVRPNGGLVLLSGPVRFEPVYPASHSLPSRIMQGGAVSRVYKLTNPATGSSIDEGLVLIYRSCDTATPRNCGPEKKSTIGNMGIVSIESDWITDPPRSTVQRTIEVLNTDSNGTPSVTPTDTPLFPVLVYPRSLKQEWALDLSGELGTGAGAGIGIGPAKARLAELGITGGLGINATISYDINSYDSRYAATPPADSTAVGFKLGTNTSIKFNLTGPQAEVPPLETEFKLGPEAGVKFTGFGTASYKFPKFFDPSPTIARPEALSLVASIFDAAYVITAKNNPFIKKLLGELYKQTVITNYLSENGYSGAVEFKGSLGVKATVGGSEFTMAGFGLGAVGEWGKNYVRENGIEKTKYNTAFTTTFTLNPPDFLKFFKPSSPMGNSMALEVEGTATNEVVYSPSGKPESVKLGMTLLNASGKVFEGGGYDEKLYAFTDNPQIADWLVSSGIGSGSLSLVRAGAIVSNSGILSPDSITEDLKNMLNRGGLIHSTDNPLQYSNETNRSYMAELPLEFEGALGLKLKLGLNIKAKITRSSTGQKGVDLATGTYAIETYQEDDYLRAKERSFSDFTGVYKSYLSDTVSSLTRSAWDSLEKGAVATSKALSEGGAIIRKKTGDILTGLTGYITSTFSIPAASKVVALKTATTDGTAKTVASVTFAAVTIGQIHFVNVTDAAGADLTTLPKPLELSIGYSLTDLAAAGLSSADASRIRLYQWDQSSGYWLFVGGSVDTTAQSVTADITTSGSFVLAVDFNPPVVSGFTASDATPQPTLSARITDDLSGLDPASFSFDIDGAMAVTGGDLSLYYSPLSGSFAYRVAQPLAPGTHRATMRLKDSAGNAATVSLEFPVASAPPVISHTPAVSANSGEALTVTATVTGGSGIRECWLLYGLNGDSGYRQRAMTINGSSCSATILATEMNGKRLEYYLRVIDLGGYDGVAPTGAPAAGRYALDLNEGTTRRLTVTLDGSGSGSVVSSPAGINCTQGTCSATFAPGTVVRLTATPSGPGSLFGGWSAEQCPQTVCDVSLNTGLNISAMFLLKPMNSITVTMAGTGSGTVTSTPAGISCISGSSSGCSYATLSSTPLTLFATPDINSTFEGWSGACLGKSSCAVPMDGAYDTTAGFILAPPTRVGDVGYQSLQEAYAAAPGSATVKLKRGVLAGGLIAGRGVSVTLEGGYDAPYAWNSGARTTVGAVKIRQGKVTFRNVGVK